METITKIEDVHCPLRILTLHLNKKKLPHNILDPFCEVSLVLMCLLAWCTAPEAFRLLQDEVLEDLHGVEVITDDIPVYGVSDSEAEAILVFWKEASRSVVWS